MSVDDLSFDGFLGEFQATLAQGSGDAALRRINAERLLALLAEDLIEDHEAERIRILPDKRLAGESEVDFLLQIDDYEIRIELLDGPDGTLSLDPKRLPQLISLLENNANTVCLVLVWTTDDLPAVAFTVAELRQLVKEPDRLAGRLAEATPLPEVLRGILAQQIKLWDVGLDTSICPEDQPRDTCRLFEKAIMEALDAERDRRYRNAARQEAARQFPTSREKQVITEALERALGGASAREILPYLTKIAQRGDT